MRTGKQFARRKAKQMKRLTKDIADELEDGLALRPDAQALPPRLVLPLKELLVGGMYDAAGVDAFVLLRCFGYCQHCQTPVTHAPELSLMEKELQRWYALGLHGAMEKVLQRVSR